MARRVSRKSRSQRKRSDTGVAGALAKLTVRRPSAHGGYGWVRDLPDDRDFVYGAPLVRFPQGLPRSVDLRSECPPVYDQGQLGSCTGNGIAGAIEFDQRKQRTKEFTPSRLFIYYNERSHRRHRQSGCRRANSRRDQISRQGRRSARERLALQHREVCRSPAAQGLQGLQAGSRFSLFARRSGRNANARLPCGGLSLCIRLYGLPKL